MIKKREFMNKKEEQQIIKIQYSLDSLYEIVNNLEKVCLEENIIFFKEERNVYKCKKHLLIYLDKIQKITDKMLGTE